MGKFIYGLQSMTGFKDVFISYGRADSKEFAIKLEQRLVEAGFSVWLDLNDIPLAIDFQKYIDNSLPKAHNFLFVASPYAINSEYCALELERALQFKKRIIPLIHVEEISKETWQQRYPHGTDSDWEQYRAEGQHSIHPNMHPSISKLNWAFFEENKNDFEQAFQSLIVLLNTEVTYVHQHTSLLNKALAWTENQRQTRYLLTGKSCQTAAKWLTSKNELVSCQPSDLHCEFVSQSLKNANNLMCQVFLSYADEDADIVSIIRRSLLQHAFTVWTNRTDILTGEDFESAICRGIEQSDNLIYFISPEAITSQYCQDELAHALSLNKRIVPILTRPIKPELIPEVIRKIQWIDLTNNVTQKDYLQNESQILQVLKEDALYHEEHKDLLVKALKWHRQEDNPSILLRGQNLSHYQTWLKLAKQRALFGPTELQETFILKSSELPPDVTLDVFIISSSADLDFARKLNETLQIQGQSTWFEQESLVPESDFEDDFQVGITSSENIIYILSPDAIASKNRMAMLDYALASNKRIFVVTYQESQTIERPASLQNHPLFDFRQQDGDFLSNFGKLYRALESNPEYIRQHTKLLVKAGEWEQENQDDSFLLQGRTLTAAEHWLRQENQSNPPPTELQQRYIKASRELTLRRIRPLSVALLGAGTTFLVSIARIFGLLLPAELPVYDYLIKQRGAFIKEESDQRFTIIKVDRAGGEYLRERMINQVYEPGIGTIPDEALLELLEILESHKPRLIGLDFFRDFPASRDLPELREKLTTTDNLVGICKAKIILRTGEDSSDRDLGGYKPIDEVVPQDYPERIGFNDFLRDRDDRLRRHYMLKEKDSVDCDVQSSFSLLLARRYLEGEGLSFTTPFYTDEQGKTQLQENDSIKFDQLAIPRLNPFGWRLRGVNAEKLLGYQALLNFRLVDGKPDKFADSLSLAKVLENPDSEELPGLIRDRIVLIGITDLSDKNTDTWRTPFGFVPGVFLHGQMASQIISATLDERRLIWWLSLRDELIWIFGWSVVGGFIVWGFYQPVPLALAAGGGVLLIYASAWVVMIFFTGFLPTIPAIVTLLSTGGLVMYRNYKLRKV